MKCYSHLEHSGFEFTIVATNSHITNILFGIHKIGDAQFAHNRMIDDTELQLRQYLDGRLRRFSVPAEPEGTEFQQSVWDAISRIPYGQTLTYADIARAIGHPRAVRAVGMACNRNPIPLVVPCHRVVGAGGKLTGFGGGVDLKQRLLEIEK